MVSSLTKSNQKKRSLSRENLGQQIADSLEEEILSSSHRAGEKFSSAAEISEEFGVSRPVAREALGILQERGLILLKNGSGSFITKPDPVTLSPAMNRVVRMNNISKEHLTQARMILEKGIAPLAAENATEQDISAIEENLRQFENRQLSLAERVALDKEFHVLIARATGNPVLAMLEETLSCLLFDYMGKGVVQKGGIDDAIRRHRKLADAIKAHDKELAAIAMAEHVETSAKMVALSAQKQRTTKGSHAKGCETVS